MTTKEGNAKVKDPWKKGKAKRSQFGRTVAKMEMNADMVAFWFLSVLQLTPSCLMGSIGKAGGEDGLTMEILHDMLRVSFIESRGQTREVRLLYSSSGMRGMQFT